MARKAKGRPSGVPYDYVPDVFDNKKDPDPVGGEITPPTERERRALLSGYSGAETYEDTVRSMESACAKHVGKLRNYKDNNDAPIVTGDQLAEFGETEFVAAFYNEIITSTIWTGEKKKASGG